MRIYNSWSTFPSSFQKKQDRSILGLILASVKGGLKVHTSFIAIVLKLPRRNVISSSVVSPQNPGYTGHGSHASAPSPVPPAQRYFVFVSQYHILKHYLMMA